MPNQLISSIHKGVSDIVESILTTPKDCLENQIDTKEEKESPNSKQKTTPIIDLFLNPARSEELKDVLKQLERRGASASRTKVTNDQ